MSRTSLEGKSTLAPDPTRHHASSMAFPRQTPAERPLGPGPTLPLPPPRTSSSAQGTRGRRRARSPTSPAPLGPQKLDPSRVWRPRRKPRGSQSKAASAEPGPAAARRSCSLRCRQPPLLPAARTNQSPLRGTGK
ncbi:uncharacterized protein LOC118591268 isoform X2 [Onychomys torridus]|uniref:uncharacterized protein LOC118591268 isoform X2 n=1 Tax=Onychomys torridus TaxID=38674 RepID=UPI00167F2DD5|nr:uncharacterized protein LOC118591268 isoform X2 [Onychomys torridus]